MSPASKAGVSEKIGDSLIPERSHRIEPRRGPSRGEAGEQTCENRDDHAYKDQAKRKLDWKRGKRLAKAGAHHIGKPQSDESAEQTQRSGFDQELKQDRASPPAQSFACPDFTRALLHAHKRDVHYSDRADKKRKTGDKKSRDSNGILDWIQGAFQRLLFVDAEVVFFLRWQSANSPHDSDQLVSRFRKPRFVLHLYENVGIAFGAEVFLKRGQWHHHNRIKTE